ncbi:MAG: hypothetical protein U0R81_16185 [Mycobacterium sp.]
MTSRPMTMDVLAITATDILQMTPVDGEAGIAAVIGCPALAHIDLHHDVVLWFDAAHTDPQRRPNMAAVCLLCNCSDQDPDVMPIPADTVVLTGTDPTTGAPAPLRSEQYIALAQTLMAD